MRFWKIRVASLVVGAFLALLPATSFRVTAQEGAEGVFGEIIDVRVINLEVVVTDKKGNRVPDLKSEDFRLRVDGREIPVQYFTEVREGNAAASSEEGSANLPGLEAGAAVSTSYLVFIDEVFPRAPDRNRVLQGLQDALPLLGAEDRMAIAAFDGRRLEMLSTWSQSKEHLNKILERAKGRISQAYLYTADREFAADERADLDVPLVDVETGEVIEQPQTHSEIVARRYVDEFERRLGRMTTAVNSTLRSFAKPPGRKVMLMLAGGWPFSPVEYFIGTSGPTTDFGLDRTPKTLQRISETANRIGYTLYPIDVEGQRGQRVAADSNTTVDPVTLTDPNNPEFAPVLREAEIHSTLEILARETGGEALIDAASFSALDRVISDTRSYYWLGFTPDWRGNDSDHKIKLDTQRPGLKVRARKGFQDLSRTTEISYQVEGALLIGQLPGSDPLEVKVGPGGKSRRGRVQVPLTVTIPMDAVTMLPQRGQYVAQMELRVAVLDESGDRNDLPVIPVELGGPELPQPGQHAIYETTVKIRAEDHDLVIALFDPPSGRMLSTVKRYRHTKR